MLKCDIFLKVPCMMPHYTLANVGKASRPYKDPNKM